MKIAVIILVILSTVCLIWRANKGVNTLAEILKDFIIHIGNVLTDYKSKIESLEKEINELKRKEVNK